MGSPGSEEQELAAAMRTAASEVVLPAGLVAGGITRGRQMRRARRIRMGASVVAVLAVAGTGLVVASGTERAPRSREASGAAAVVVDSTLPSTSPGPEAGGTRAGKEPVSAQAIALILLQIQWTDGKQVEPKGASLPLNPGDATNPVGASASILLNNVNGFTRLTVQVMSSTPKSFASDCSEATKAGGICRPFAEPDGTRGYIAEYISGGGSTVGGSGQSGAVPPGALVRSVRLTRPDGVEISVTAAAERAPAGVVGATMPLAMDRLKETALSTVWQLWVDPEVNRIARGKVVGFEDQAGKPPHTASRAPLTSFPPVSPPSRPAPTP